MNNLAYNPAFAPVPIVAIQCAAQNLDYHWSKHMSDIDIPENVKEMMRIDGVNTHGLVSREVVRAIINASADGKLVENPHGVTLADRIKPPARPKTMRKKYDTYAEAEEARRRGEHHHEDEHSHSNLLAF
jgi:hypothetical protein